MLTPRNICNFNDPHNATHVDFQVSFSFVVARLPGRLRNIASYKDARKMDQEGLIQKLRVYVSLDNVTIWNMAIDFVGYTPMGKPLLRVSWLRQSPANRALPSTEASRLPSTRAGDNLKKRTTEKLILKVIGNHGSAEGL